MNSHTLSHLRLLDADVDLLLAEWVRFRTASRPPYIGRDVERYNKAGAEIDLTISRMITGIKAILKDENEK
jgi:hypothetical protein